MRLWAKVSHWLPACLVMAGGLIAGLTLWMTSIQAAVRESGKADPVFVPRAYLPFIAHLACKGNVVIDGGFEQGGEAWYQYTTGMGWKAHKLIGSDAEGFEPHGGLYAARLGGYEGVWDVLTQTVTIPLEGRLSYWWQMRTYESSIFYDHFAVGLLTPEGESLAHLASHDVRGPQGIWQQDVVDVADYAGQTLILRFYAYNDNYYFSWFDLDEVCLVPAW